MDAAASIGLQSCGLRIRSSLWLGGRTSDGGCFNAILWCPANKIQNRARYGNIWQVNTMTYYADSFCEKHPVSYNCHAISKGSDSRELPQEAFHMGHFAPPYSNHSCAGSDRIRWHEECIQKVEL